MEDYKANVFKGDKFEYQNAHWEENYAEFVKAQKEKDTDHQNEMSELVTKKAEFEKKKELKRQKSGVYDSSIN